MTQATCNVIRDGAEMSIESAQVVVGDLIVLQVGDVVSADVRLIESNELKVDRSLLLDQVVRLRPSLFGHPRSFLDMITRGKKDQL